MRYESPAFTTPVPVSSNDRKQIEEQSPRTMGELLQNVPGVYAAENGVLGNSKPVIRGFHGDRVLVMIDGQRLQSSLGGIWGGPDLSLVDPDQLERVEVVYGPGSSLYGSDSIGGVINLITRRAALSHTSYKSGSISTYYYTNGNGNRENLRTEASNERFAVGFSGSNRQANDYRAPDDKMENSGFHLRNGSFDATCALAENQQLSFIAQANRNKDLNRPTSKSPSADTDIATDRYDRSKVGLGYTWKNITDTIKKLKLDTYYQEDFSDFSFDGKVHPIPLVNLNTSSTGGSKLWTAGAQGQIELSLLDTYTVTGFDYYHNESGPNKTRSATSGMIFGFYKPESITDKVAEDGSADSLGLFAQNEFSPLDRLHVTLGMRYDWYKADITSHDDAEPGSGSSSDSAVTGTFAASYELTDWFRPYVNIGKGFRAPSLRDLYYRGTVPGGLLAVGNPDLKPEKSMTYNLGIKVQTERIEGALTVFHSRVRDMIVGVTKKGNPSDGSPAGVVQKENLGKAELWGVEGFCLLRLTGRVAYSFDYSYTQGLDKVNHWPLQAVPPARLGQKLRYEDRGALIAGVPVWAEIEFTYRFRQNRIARDWDVERMQTPGSGVWDYRCGLTLPKCGGRVQPELYLALTNITNKRYTEIPLYDGYDLLTLPGVGATIGVKLKF